MKKTTTTIIISNKKGIVGVKRNMLMVGISISNKEKKSMVRHFNNILRMKMNILKVIKKYNQIK